MEPFKLDRQAKAFLAVIVVLALAMVPLAPFVSLALGAISVVLLPAVCVKSAVRNRRLFGPFSQAEGALVLSAAAFAACGVLVVAYMTLMLGAGNAMMLSHAMLPFSFTAEGPRPVGGSSVWYSDPDMRQKLKDELGKAGIPFTLETREGKEYVKWSQEHNAAVEAINRKVRDGPLPNGRHTRFQDPATQKEFADWLAGKGIRHETVKQHGEDWIVWEGAENLVHQFMTDRSARPCKNDKKTAQAPAAPKCS